MTSKEMVTNVITEYVIAKEAGAFDITYLKGVIHGIGGGFGTGLWVERETYYGEFRYPFSGDFETVIADLYRAIEGGEFSE